MTIELLSFAGLSFLVFENYENVGGADFNLISDNRLAGTAFIFLFFFTQSHTNAGL